MEMWENTEISNFSRWSKKDLFNIITKLLKNKQFLLATEMKKNKHKCSWMNQSL